MNALMKLCLTDPELVRSKQLSQTQIELYNYIKSQPSGVLSSYLAQINGTNRNVAHERLQNLWKKGYLKRIKSLGINGGFEYRYEAILFGDDNE